MSSSWGNANDHHPIDSTYDWPDPPDKNTDDHHLAEIFFELTRQLQEQFEINRGLLAIRENSSTRFLATATFSQRKIRKNLSLRIPEESSLFSKVAEQREIFTDEFFDLFSGNSFEKKLLLDDDTRSYVILPIKQEGEVIGLLGYSSTTPYAFSTLERIGLERLTFPLAQYMKRHHSQVKDI